MTRPSAVVFTDLDGTLLDDTTYDPGPAVPALHRLIEAGAVVVFCSSKTFAEQRWLQGELGVGGPCIVENGAAVVFPQAAPLVFGLSYEEVRTRLGDAAHAARADVVGYGDLTPEEVAHRMGLDVAAAARARDRAYSETFFLPGGEAADRLAVEAARRGLTVSPGSRAHTAHGPHDKGTAVRALLERFGAEGDGPPSFAIGDHRNDAPMLAAVDLGFLVQRPGGSWEPVRVPGLVEVAGQGPAGWQRAAAMILARITARESTAI